MKAHYYLLIQWLLLKINSIKFFIFQQSFLALSCLATLVMADSQVGLYDGIGGIGGYGRPPPIAPYGRPLGGFGGSYEGLGGGPGAFGPGPVGGFGPGPYGGAVGGFGRPPYGGSVGGFGPAPYGGGFGGAPGAFGPAPYGGPIGGFGPRQFGQGSYGGGLGGFGPSPYGGGFGGAPGAFGPAPLGGGFGGLGPAPIGPAAGLYAPSNYQFGYGVQADGYNGAATFGHNEEHNAYGTNGNYHVNTPGSFQTVNYNIAH